MKTSEPSYSARFECLAEKCPENCCMEWDVDIDKKTADYYRSLSGAFGDKLRRSMKREEEPEIPEEVLKDSELSAIEDPSEKVEDEVPDDGLFSGLREDTFRLDGIRCPFLQEDGLCEIRIRLGYENTPYTCREHPVNTEEYETFAETSPSVSCPAVAKLVLETPVSNAYPPAPENEGKDPVLRLLCRKRNAILSAFDEGKSLNRHGTELMDIAQKLQIEINRVAPDFAYDFPGRLSVPKIRETLKFLRNDLTILTERWRMQLDKAISVSINLDAFNEFQNRHTAEITRMFAYFVYRYYLKAVNDCAILVWSAFIADCAFVPAYLSFISGEPFSNTYAWFSREIEHDRVNAEAFLDYFDDVIRR